MEQLKHAIRGVLKLQEQHSLTARTRSVGLRNLKQQSPLVVQNGTNALALIDSPPVSTVTFAKAMAILQANYGAEYSPEKTALLFDTIDDDGWSEAQFERTMKWFLKNKPFPAWTISDWFSYGVKVFPYAWYLEQAHKNGACVNKQIECYDLGDGVTGYKYRDGETLPFPHKMVGAKEWEFV